MSDTPHTEGAKAPDRERCLRLADMEAGQTIGAGTPPAERPTPITDRNERDTFLKTGQMAAKKVVSSEVARDLERQLSVVSDAFNKQVDARHEVERQLAEVRENEAAMRSIAAACTCPAKDAEIAILKAQLAGAREQRDHYLVESNRLAEELKQERAASFREQRDALLEALEKSIPLFKGSFNQIKRHAFLPTVEAAIALAKGGAQ